MELKRPDRRVTLCWTVYTLVGAIVPLAISMMLFQLPLEPWMPYLFTVLWVLTLTLMVTVVYPLRYRRMRYAVDDNSIITVQGFLFATRRRMPLSAVRHITAVRGPLERLTGITALLVSATGGRLWLEGVPVDEADKLTRAIL